jgi:LysM repeat protein
MITITDITRSKRQSTRQFSATLPNYPVENLWKTSRDRAGEEFKLLGGKPVQHWGAVGAERLMLDLQFSDNKGISIYQNVILPSFGDADEEPHLMLIAWGSGTDDTFTGRPAPYENHEVTRVGGKITMVVIGYELVEDSRQVTRVANAAGQVVAVPDRTHIVKPNETMGSIAKLYNVTLDALFLANTGQPWRPVPGTRLVIPR